MAWVRIDEDFAQHPKVLRAGPLGMAMHIAALCYCNRHLTDGFVPKQMVKQLLDLDGIGMRMWSGDHVGGGVDAEWHLVVEDLVEAGLWEEAEGGWVLHDYLDYQPSKQDVLRLREARSEAGRRGGQASRKQPAKQQLKQVPSNSLSKSQSKPESKIEAKSKPVPVPVSKIPIQKEERRTPDVEQVTPSDGGPSGLVEDFPPIPEFMRRC